MIQNSRFLLLWTRCTFYMSILDFACLVINTADYVLKHFFSYFSPDNRLCHFI